MSGSVGRIAAAVLFALAVPTASSARQLQDSPADQIDARFEYLTTTDSPGLAVVVVQNGEVLLRRGYGLANLEHRVAITPSTVFDIASVSKQFTGLAISILVEEGKISLEDDVRDHIPEMADFGHPVTVDHLVHHTSGIRDWPGTLGVAGWRMDDVISFDQILTFAFNQEDLNFVPGAEYTYSNTGFNLLAEVVARATGQSFREWTWENLFEPLGMTATHFHDDHTEVVPNRAYGYSRGPGGTWHAVPNGLTALGSSSLYTSVDDLAKWVMNFDDPKAGSPSALDRMKTRGVLNDGSRIGYAFGVNIGEYRGRPGEPLAVRSHLCSLQDRGPLSGRRARARGGGPTFGGAGTGASGGIDPYLRSGGIRWRLQAGPGLVRKSDPGGRRAARPGDRGGPGFHGTSVRIRFLGSRLWRIDGFSTVRRGNRSHPCLEG
jgi:CubicO group peptidase (beta-lactamase class C family)